MAKPQTKSSNRGTALDLTKRSKFLAALRLGHPVTKACELASWGRRTAYDARDSDREFADAWDDAIEASVDELEVEVRKRALDPEYKWSHLMLMFLLKKFRPEFKESYKTEQKLTVEHVREISFSNDEMDEAIRILTAAKGAGDSGPAESS